MTAAAIAGMWLLTGVVGVLILRHRGHDTYSWSILFLFLGPIAIPLAIAADHDRPHATDERDRDGRFDVLVAHDGTDASATAVCSALELLDGTLTSVTLATVVDFEAASTVRGRETTVDSEQGLDAVASRLRLSCGPADTVLLYGDPPTALAEFAAAHGYELIVVPTARHRGGSRRSVARRLAATARVPVLVAPVTP